METSQTTTLQNGQVVVTTAVDLSQFISAKQAELSTITYQITQLTERQSNILDELQALLG